MSTVVQYIGGPWDGEVEERYEDNPRYIVFPVIGEMPSYNAHAAPCGFHEERYRRVCRLAERAVTLFLYVG